MICLLLHTSFDMSHRATWRVHGLPRPTGSQGLFRQRLLPPLLSSLSKNGKVEMCLPSDTHRKSSGGED
jgi:hypothetical protein